MGKPQYLTEWEFFVWRHRGQGNLLLHFLSLGIWYGFLVSFFLTFNLWLLLLIPLSQGIGLLGHVWFEEGGVRSRDFVKPHTIWYLTIIFGLYITGRYKSELSKVTDKITLNNDGKDKISELEGNLFYGH